MTDYQAVLLKLHQNLNILQQREAKYLDNVPLDLLNQISDHKEAIALTQRVIAGELAEANWREALKPLLISLNIFGNIDESAQSKLVASPAVTLPIITDPHIVAHHTQLRIFLCHASEDKPRVTELYHHLKEAGYHPWLDKFDLLPGQDWWLEIEKIIRNPYNLVLVCLSHNSVTKRGVVQREIKRALDVLDEMPEETIYLIPARLEACEVPERLSRLHWVNLFEPDGFESLNRALDYEIGKRQATHLPFEPELILIPAGKFLMGSDPSVDKDARDEEKPQHRLALLDYYIAKTPVTNAQYAAFVQATGHTPPEDWKGKEAPPGKENHPVVNVSWVDAVAYCHWLAKVTGKAYRLPTEAEWEKAARGRDGRIYPWGNEWDSKRCNTEEGGKKDTTPVGAYPTGASPYGVLDMAGNILEWCTTYWWVWDNNNYPYDATEDEWSDDYLQSGVHRVLRGGAFDFDQRVARCAHRDGDNIDTRYYTIGFRVAASPLSS